jgi:serine/threonine protein kinase
VAIKKIQGKLTEKQIEEFLREAEITRKLPPHPNVIQCVGVCLRPLCIGIIFHITYLPCVKVLEFCEGGSLFTKLQQNAFDLTQKMKIIEDICQGMIHLRWF